MNQESRSHGNGILQETCLEIRPAEEPDTRLFQGHDPRRGRLSVQEGHLAEEIAALVDGQDLLPPFLVNLRNLHPAFINHIEAARRVLFEQDHIIPAEVPLAHHHPQLGDVPPGKAPENGQFPEERVGANRHDRLFHGPHHSKSQERFLGFLLQFQLCCQ
jgi:hypothetical protein